MKQFNIKTYENQIREYIKNNNYTGFTIAEMVSDLDIDMVGMPESDEFYKAEREIRLLSNSIKRGRNGKPSYYEMTITSENEENLKCIQKLISREAFSLGLQSFEIDGITSRCEHGTNISLDQCEE